MKVRSLSKVVFVLGAAGLGLPALVPTAQGGECDQPAALYRCSEYQGTEGDLCRNYLKALEKRCVEGTVTAPSPEPVAQPAAPVVAEAPAPEPVVAEMPAVAPAPVAPPAAPEPAPVRKAAEIAAVPALAAPVAPVPSVSAKEEAPRRPAKAAREVPAPAPAPEPSPEPAPEPKQAVPAAPAPVREEAPRRPAKAAREVPPSAPAPAPSRPPTEEPAPAPVPPPVAETPAPAPPEAPAEPEARPRPPAPERKPAVRPAPAPPVGRVTRAEGSYLLCNRGSAAGAIVGQKVKILRDRREVGTGVVIGVRRDSSDVEVLSLTGVAAILAGDRIEPVKQTREERQR